jgi:hypothetical protein
MKTQQHKGWMKPCLPRTAMAAFVSFAWMISPAEAQQLYDNHEGRQLVHYQVAHNGGRLDSTIENPNLDGLNESARCGQFIRSKARYDFIKMLPAGPLQDVSAYASYEPTAPKLKMKVMTNAPAGTVIEVQLGKVKSFSAYPEGTHSQYQAVVRTPGEWEELEFQFAQVPKGSLTSPKEIDQITVLFMPNSNQVYDFYFDDLTGPPMVEVAAAHPPKKGNRR